MAVNIPTINIERTDSNKLHGGKSNLHVDTRKGSDQWAELMPKSPRKTHPAHPSAASLHSDSIP